MEKVNVFVRTCAVIVLDMGDPENDKGWQSASQIMQVRVQELLNSFDKIRVKSYQIRKFHDTLREVSIFGSATINSYLYQEALKPVMQTKKYKIIKRGELFQILAVVSYVEANLDTV